MIYNPGGGGGGGGNSKKVNTHPKTPEIDLDFLDFFRVGPPQSNALHAYIILHYSDQCLFVI